MTDDHDAGDAAADPDPAAVRDAVADALRARFPHVAFDVVDDSLPGDETGEVRLTWRRTDRWAPDPGADAAGGPDHDAPSPDEQVAAVLATFVFAGGEPSDEELDLATMGAAGRRTVEEHRGALIEDLATRRRTADRGRLGDPAIWTAERWAAAIDAIRGADVAAGDQTAAITPAGAAAARLRGGLYERLATLLELPPDPGGGARDER
ncbi:MAG: hypothetical protein S0880_24425 [Actinomycetota bacterium]|nr:hypothetical protein [Actinomycetota bacterium]